MPTERSASAVLPLSWRARRAVPLSIAGRLLDDDARVVFVDTSTRSGHAARCESAVMSAAVATDMRCDARHRDAAVSAADDMAEIVHCVHVCVYVCVCVCVCEHARISLQGDLCATTQL